ncbi:MAG: CPBP family glutamic-type intramembrane protease, partial [Pyrinomonadaceae bacterium]
METIQLIFIGKDGQLRSGWRAGVFLFGFIFFSVILGTIVQAIMFTANFESASLQSISLAANAVAALIPAIVIGWLCGKWLEKLPFGALGASFSGGWIRNFMLGIVAGGATLSFAVLVAFVLGGQRFELNLANGWQPVLTSLAVSFGVFAAAAAMEEALFRGYILQTFARSDLAWLAILLTSVFFGLVHADNPNAGVISTLNTVL